MKMRTYQSCTMQWMGWTSVSALLSWGAFPPLEWPWLACLAWVPLLVLWEDYRISVKGGVFLGAWWGAIYCFLHTYWLTALVANSVLLWWQQGLFWGVLLISIAAAHAAMGGAVCWLFTHHKLPLWWSLPPMVVLWHWWIGTWPLQGLNWGLLSVSQMNSELAIQLAPIAGGGGIALVLALFNVLWALWLIKSRAFSVTTSATYGLLLLMLTFLWLWPATNHEAGKQAVIETTAINQDVKSPNGMVEQSAPASHVSIIVGNSQINHDQRAEFSDGARMDLYKAATLHALNSAPASKKPMLAVWPESALNKPYSPYPSHSSNVQKQASTPATENLAWLYGSNAERDGKLYNAAWLIGNRSLSERGLYLKRMRVPFAEYVPNWFKMLFPRNLLGMEKDYSRGEGIPLLQWQGHQIGIAICLEGLSAQHLKLATQQGAQWVVVIANMEWLPAHAKQQQIAIMKLRSAEIGREVILSTNAGKSLHIKNGRVWLAVGNDFQQADLPSLPLAKAVLTALNPQQQHTLWVRWGYWSLMIITIIYLLVGKVLSGNNAIKKQAD